MYRERLGLTQEQLAERVHYANAGMISQIEDGLKSPSLEKAQDLAIQLGVSLSALVGETVPLHTVTNNASGDHTVIQNIEGHYCAMHQEDLAVMHEELRATGEDIKKILRVLHATLLREDPSTTDGVTRPDPVPPRPNVGAEH